MPKGRLLERVSLSLFHNGHWSELVERNVLDSESAHFAACRKRRRSKSGIEQRAARALRCVLDGELSAGRQALEGAELARGTRETLDALKDRERRPPNLRDPLPDRVVNHVPHTPVSLDPELFAQALWSSRRGAAAGPSGMTAEHLRPMLESTEDTELLASFADTFAKGEVPQEIGRAIRMGRLTAAEIGRWRERHRGWRSLPSFGVQNSREAIRPAGGRCHSPVSVRTQNTCWV